MGAITKGVTAVRTVTLTTTALLRRNLFTPYNFNYTLTPSRLSRERVAVLNNTLAVNTALRLYRNMHLTLNPSNLPPPKVSAVLTCLRNPA